MSEVGVGVDACPYGWCATKVAGDTVTIDLVKEFEEIPDQYTEELIFVDIPIGLPVSNRRRCDVIAKDLLGCRGGSVFYTVCEAAVDIDDYDEAKVIHEKNIGHGLSQQAFNIRPKIREVQSVIGDSYDGRIRESHPELCFYHLNQQPIAYSKSSERGRQMRLALLESEVEDAGPTYHEVVQERYRKEVRKDDILDSIALAIAARGEDFFTTPENPDHDEPRIYYPRTKISLLE
jgi:predicted RNase H-like nuclease